MAFPILALFGLGALVFVIAKGSKSTSAPQRPGLPMPGKNGCYAVPAYGGSGRDLSDIPPAQRTAFEVALTSSTDAAGLDGVATTLDCIGYSVAAKRFRARAAQIRASGGRALPPPDLGYGRTTPAMLGPMGLVPGCVPPIGWTQPSGWIAGQQIPAMDAASWPGMPSGYTLGSPFPAGAPCPSGWDDARLGDAGVDGLPEPLRTAVQKAIATGTDPAMLESLAQHLDAMRQPGAAAAVRARAGSAVSSILSLLDRAKTESSGAFVVELQTAMLRSGNPSRERSALLDALKLVVPRVGLNDVQEEPLRTNIKTATTKDDLLSVAHQLDLGGYTKAAAEMRAAATEFTGPLGGALGSGGDPIAALPEDVRDAVHAAYDAAAATNDPQVLDDIAAAVLVGYPAAWKKVKADAKAMRDKASFLLGGTTIDASIPLSAFPGATGSATALALDKIATDLGVTWLYSPQYLWPKSAPWVSVDGSVSGYNVASALSAAGYKQAAKDAGTLWAAG